MKREQDDLTTYYFTDIACFLIHFVWMLLFFYQQIILLGILNIISSVIYIGTYHMIAKGQLLKAVAIIYTEVLIHSIAALLCLGFHGGFELYILVFIPFMFFFAFIYGNGNRRYSVCGILAGIVYIILKAMTFFMEPRYTFINETLEFGTMVFNCVTSILILFGITFLTCKEINHVRYVLEEKNKELTFLSRYDPLTNLLNRRSMEEIIDEIEMDGRRMEDGAVAFFDIDNFKRFNDCFGHDCGDLVLAKVAELIRSNAISTGNGAQGYTCRWGGEEIIVLYHGCDKEEILCKVTQTKEQVSISPIEFGGKNVSVSITCGVAFSREGKNIRDLINEADGYMLKGKHNGKNCVVTEKSVMTVNYELE